MRLQGRIHSFQLYEKKENWNNYGTFPISWNTYGPYTAITIGNLSLVPILIPWKILHITWAYLFVLEKVSKKLNKLANWKYWITLKTLFFGKNKVKISKIRTYMELVDSAPKVVIDPKLSLNVFQWQPYSLSGQTGFACLELKNLKY